MQSTVEPIHASTLLGRLIPIHDIVRVLSHEDVAMPDQTADTRRGSAGDAIDRSCLQRCSAAASAGVVSAARHLGGGIRWHPVEENIRAALMRLDVKDRANRETQQYDSGLLRRDGFETALTYLNSGFGRLRRNEAIRTAMREATGARVLEIGSQSWEWCLLRYGYRPQQLTCINISQAELDIGRAHAAKLGFTCDFRRMDAHDLEFSDGSLDMVFGVAILHHLDFARAMREVHRVLRVGGKIVFMEPLRHNPVGRMVRWLTPHARTPDEMPLGRPELRLVDKNFDADNYYSEMFTVIGTMIAQPFSKNPINPVARFCDHADDLIVRIFPGLGCYYRSVVIRGTKAARAWRD